jgi:hypothetical protein
LWIAAVFARIRVGTPTPTPQKIKPINQSMKNITRTLLSLFALGSLPCSAATLVGQWTFEGGSLADTTGNFGNLTLSGDASIINGALDVNGTGTTVTGWAVTSGNGGLAAIGSKTMVSWITLQGLSTSAKNGSAMTLDSKTIDQFDGIVFAEQDANRWMNGSNGWLRSPNGQFAAVETSINLDIVQLAITYQNTGGNVTITGYRNGVNIGSYTDTDDVTWAAGDQEVIFGKRHTNPLAETSGALDALIHEARLYDGALTQAEIQGLVMVPEPSAALLGGLGMLALLRRRR